MTMRWYVVHAYSGQEKSIQQALIERIKRSGMADKFGEVLVPTEEVVEMRAGQSDGYRAVPKTLQVDAKACTRYYIASKKTADGFEPVVSTMERIKECENLTAGKSGGM